MPRSLSRLATLSSIHAAMVAIRSFSDPECIIVGKPRDDGKYNKKWKVLYDRLVAIHNMASEAVEKDEREAK